MIYIHELKQNRRNLAIWAIAVGVMIFICMMLFPQMKEQVDQVSAMFSSMGDFSSAFGMDKISIGTPMGFFAVECGSILAIGGVLYCALLGIGMLSKEENLHTAEFLFTHPVSRYRVLCEKLAAVVTLVVLFYLAGFFCTVVSFACIGEKVQWQDLTRIFLANGLLGLQTAGILFGVSSFFKTSAAGVGIGIGTLFYFLNLYGNIAENADWVKYVTPFSYADASAILADAGLKGNLMLLGIVYLVVGIFVGCIYYAKKDIS